MIVKMKFFSILVLCLIQYNHLQSQYCGTSHVDQQRMIDLSSGEQGNSRPDFAQTIYIPLLIHSLSNDGSSSYYGNWQLYETLGTLNKDFEKSGIQFFLEKPIHYISRTKWNDHKDYNDGEEMMIENNVADQVNCYLVQNPAGNCGYYTYNGDGVALSKSCLGKLSHTWAHELGHFFSLPHTFFGWEGIDYSFQKSTAEYKAKVWNQIENVERIDCNSQADQFCDTEPDYISDRWPCDANNRSLINLKDLNDSIFNADGSLFMSYAFDGCMSRFSNEQNNGMLNNISNRRQILLRPNVKPIYQNTDSFDFIYPLNESTVPYKSLTITWPKVEGAKYYLVQVARAPSFSIIVKNEIIESTSTYIDSLLPGKTYYARVKAVNDFEFNGTYAHPIKFYAEGLQTSNSDGFGTPEVTVFPNPVTRGKNLIVTFPQELGVQNIEIMTIAGQRVTDKLNWNMYNRSMATLTDLHLSSGVYVLQLTTESGIIAKRIVVE